jgi:hypothetical protein
MPLYDRALDVYQGFYFRNGVTTPVGYIFSLKIGGTLLTADIANLKDPINPALANTRAVAVLNHILWETGAGDPIYFSGQISTANKQTIASKLATTTMIPAVELAFAVYEYDPLVKKYFVSFETSSAAGAMGAAATATGSVVKNGNELNIAVAELPSHEVQSPQNFAFQIGVAPKGSNLLTLATAGNKNIGKPWSGA